MAFEATGYYVIVRPDPTEEVSEGGIVLATETVTANKFATNYGTIVSVGPIAWDGFADGRKWAAIGDHVLYARYAGKRLETDDGDELVVMCDSDILAVERK